MFGSTVVGRVAPIPVPLTSTSVCPVWDDAQAFALTSLKRVVDEGFVFGAVTGPRKSGKSSVISKILETSKSADRVCVDIRMPNQVSLKTAESIEEAIGRVIAQSRGGGIHVLIAVDNAHTATRELLALLNRLAGAESFFGSPQMIFAGEPEFWHRLASRCYENLVRRIAIRCSLENLKRFPKTG